jgi:RNA polymerase sigma-54 factor
MLLRNQVRQTQYIRMFMTPELRQGIELLQLSRSEILEFIQNEMNENPLLEFKETRYNSYSGVQLPSQLISNDVSLERHLLEQLSFMDHILPIHHEVIRYLIGNLNPSGYLEMTLKDASADLGIAIEVAEEGLAILQTLDPVGVGARDLKECLLIQARNGELNRSNTIDIIQFHLEDLAANRFKLISKALGLSLAEIQLALDDIRSFNPRPGQLFINVATKYIIPDVIIQQNGNQFEIKIDDQTAPKLIINSYYKTLAEQQNHELAEYVHHKMIAANKIIKSIDQRRITLRRVMEAILEIQQDFFSHGFSHLKSMTQKSIAEKLGLHESTISRVISQKYSLTPHGTYELKFFFTSGLNADGELISSKTIKKQIQLIIQQENANNPLSDQQIAQLLRQENCSLSRRTVAKYREELGLPPSSKRRRY